jgi:hypothetical protein
MISTLPMTCLRRIRGSGPDVRVWKPDSGIVARRGDVDRQCRQRKKCTCPRGGLVRSASLLVYSATLRGRSKKCTSIGQHVRVCFAASWLGSPWRGTMHRKGKSAHAHEEVWGDPPRSWSTRPRCEAGPKSARRSADMFAFVLRYRGWARHGEAQCSRKGKSAHAPRRSGAIRLAPGLLGHVARPVQKVHVDRPPCSRLF